MLKLLIERYPLIVERVTCSSLHPFERVYLQLHGLIERCVELSMNEDMQLDEKKFCISLFQHVDYLLILLRPQKEIFLVLDGSLPNALIPNSRIFRFLKRQSYNLRFPEVNVNFRESSNVDIAGSSSPYDNAINVNIEDSQEIEQHQERFDYHNLLPGTSFLNNTEQYLLYYICAKLHTEEPWKNLRIFFSGSSEPGDGKQKILQFLHHSALKDPTDVNRRICLYTPTLDCILMCLALHQENISFLMVDFPMESVTKTENLDSRIFGASLTCQIVHLHLLRECIVLDLFFATRTNSCDLSTKQQERTFAEDRESYEKNKQSLFLDQKEDSAERSISSKLNSMFVSGEARRIILDFLLLCILCNDAHLLRLPFLDTEQTEFSQVLDTYHIFISNSCSDDIHWLTSPNGDINWSVFQRFLKLFPLRVLDFSTSLSSSSSGKKEKELQSSFFECNTLDKDRVFTRINSSSESDEKFSRKFFFPKQIQPFRHGFVDATALPVFSPPTFDFAYHHKADPERLYYLWYFGWDISRTESQTKLRHLVLSFCKALQWTLWYFCRGVCDWLWSYPFRYFPLCNTLIQFLPDSSTIQFSGSSRALSCVTQLVHYLHPSQYYLFPTALREAISKHPQALASQYTSASGALKNSDFVFVYLKNPELMIWLESKKNTLEVQPERSLFPLNCCSPTVLTRDESNPIFLSSPFPNVFKSLNNCYVKIKPVESCHHPFLKDTPELNICLNEPSFPSLLSMDIAHVKFGSLSSPLQTRTNQQKPYLRLDIYPLQHKSLHSISPTDYDTHLYNFLKSLFEEDICQYDYPYRNVGKITGLLGKNWYFRKKDLPFEGLDALGLFDVLHIRSNPPKSQKNKNASDSAFLHRCEPINSVSHRKELLFQMSRLEALGLLIMSSEFKINTKHLVKALSEASGKDCTKYFLEENFTKEYSLNNIVVEFLPVAEVITASSMVKYKFRPQPLYRPLSFFFREYKISKACSNPSNIEVDVGTTVICVNEFNPLYGCVGFINTVAKTFGTSESLLEVYQDSYDDRWALQNEIYNLAIEDLETTKWYYLDEVSQITKLPERIVTSLLQSVWVDAGGPSPFDIGFRLYYTKDNINFCVPSYTSFVPDYDAKRSTNDTKPLLTDLAINLLNSFKQAWPSVIEGLSHIRNKKKGELSDYFHPIQVDILFPRATAVERFHCLLEWCLKQKQIHMWRAGPSTQALSLNGVKEIEKNLNFWVSKFKTCHHVRVTGLNEVYPIRQTGVLPDILLGASPHRYIQTEDFSYLGRLLIGQRVVYVKWNGELPFGAVGCVTATTLDLDGLEQWVELITERPYLSCTDLNGRCSPFRGVQVPASSLIPIVPTVLPWGLSISSLSEFQALIQDSVRRLECQGSTPNTLYKNRYSPNMHYIVGPSDLEPSVNEESQNNKLVQVIALETLTFRSCKEEKSTTSILHCVKEMKNEKNEISEPGGLSVEVNSLSVVERLLEFKSQLQTIQNKKLSLSSTNDATYLVTVGPPKLIETEHQTVSAVKQNKPDLPCGITTPSAPNLINSQDSSLCDRKKLTDKNVNINFLLDTLKRGPQLQTSDSCYNIQHVSPEAHPTQLNYKKKFHYDKPVLTQPNIMGRAQSSPSLRRQQQRRRRRRHEVQLKNLTRNPVGNRILNILCYGDGLSYNTHRPVYESSATNSKCLDTFLPNPSQHKYENKKQIKHGFSGHATQHQFQRKEQMNLIFKKESEAKPRCLQSKVAIPSVHYKAILSPVAPSSIPTFLPGRFS